MEYGQLGRSGVEVSRLILGTMNFGRHTTEEDSFEILDTAIDHGVNFIDTADVYGPNGLTEEIVGRWLQARPAARDQVVLATKVFGKVGEGRNDRGLSAFHIRRAVEGSLRRLQVDHIDLYQFHHIDRRVPWEEIWTAIDVLIDQGKISYTGSSNFAGWNIAEAQVLRQNQHRLGLVSEQSLYNLVARDVEREVLPAAQRFGVSIIAWSPLHAGLLAGSSLRGEGTTRRDADRTGQKRGASPERIDRLSALAEELDTTAAILSLSWLLHQPGVLGPIIGPRTLEHLTSAFDAFDLPLDEATLTALDEIFPAFGAAPEAYAW